MKMAGIEGDGVVMLGLVLPSVNLGDSKLGLAIQGYMIRKCLSMDVVVETSILVICILRMEEDAKTLCPLWVLLWHVHNVAMEYMWHGKKALSLFCQMTNMSLKPNHATFAALLSALSHSGPVNEGRYWFNHGKPSIRKMPAKCCKETHERLRKEECTWSRDFHGQMKGLPVAFGLSNSTSSNLTAGHEKL
ncbi:hypothetical protein F3Y22_tig00110548pilonHSYRG00893 [Hibiscus syriacus]|uniref:Pentatricopeptide repeat-containing protein n=1 Tax=Hibiscus syriacus TaxID=106335 RepID=A0A6A3ABN1_HIBSY|nr:hypothetical protein F3Y22_tig00110548pilonHSYRG00893 [Hibiscus syriacus]